MNHAAMRDRVRRCLHSTHHIETMAVLEQASASSG